MLGGHPGRNSGFGGGAGGHFKAGGFEIGLQRVEHFHGQFRAPQFEILFLPVAVEADGIGDVFGEGLAVVAFADEDVAV